MSYKIGTFCKHVLQQDTLMHSCYSALLSVTSAATDRQTHMSTHIMKLHISALMSLFFSHGQTDSDTHTCIIQSGAIRIEMGTCQRVSGIQGLFWTAVTSFIKEYS